MEYILAIEGCGWSTNGLSDSSAGFDGDVWVTDDLDGTLASDLGCTIHNGLVLQGGINESIDPRDGKYSVGGLSVQIVDSDDWWLSNYTPRAAGTASTLAADLEYNGTTISITDDVYDENDTVWIGGRELVKLGTEAGGGPYTYTGSTRGYLGTQRGSVLRRPDKNIHNLWVSATSTNNVAKFWFDRRVALYAHVPGEGVTNCLLLWVGKLRGISNEKGVGVNYSLDLVGDFLGELATKYKQRSWVVTRADDMNTPAEYKTFHLPNGSTYTLQIEPERISYTMRLHFDAPEASGDPNEANGQYALAQAYRYRTEAGGTAGMVSGWDAETVQALDDGTLGNDLLMSFVKIDDDVIFMTKLDDSLSAANPRVVQAERWSKVTGEFASDSIVSSLTGQRAHFLLDNWHDSKLMNRFQIDGRVSRHPIDVLLCFLTSMDREFFRADAIAGSTTTVTEFTVGTVGAVNLWAGKALFSVEQANTKFEAKVIASNTADDITIESAFSNAAVSGNEFQVRNSIYDVLPAGWGMGIDSSRIDIASFETIRQRYLPGEEVGRFILGNEDEVDVWKVLQEYILKPYGILLRFSRSAGKIEAVYLGQALGDGLVQDYTAISEDDIIEPGDIKHTFHPPISEIKVEVRSTDEKVIGRESKGGTLNAGDYVRDDVPAMFGDGKTKISVRSTEIEAAFQESARDKLEFKPLFDTVATLGPLLARMYGLVALYSIPPPVWTCELDAALYPSIAVGDWVSVTYNSPAAPVNSLTGARGWSTVAGRVVGINLQLDQRPTFTAQIEMFFSELNSRKIAPAATVTSHGTDGNGDYYVVNTSDFTNDSTDKDSFSFTTGDLIVQKDSTGADIEAHTIKGFGASYTTGAASGTDGTRIYVVGSISGSTSGDYLTFDQYSGSTTARMQKFAAYGDASGGLTGGDTAGDYS